MTRFDILAILAAQSHPISCKRLAELSGERRWYRRSFQADLATRLRRLYKWGLLHRWQAAGGRSGRKYVWSLSNRGQERLEWSIMESEKCVDQKKRNRGSNPVLS